MAEDAEQIIRKVGRMREMLKSVYEFNSRFLLDDEQEKLLARILFAMSVIDRKYFIENDYYIDTALPIGEGQTISQPSTVARMLLLAEIEENEDVLEVGIGSGWNASLISYLVYPGNVVSIDLLANLKDKAEKNLSGLRNYLKQKKPEIYEKLEKINFYAENIFSRKKAWKKKYDKIIITAGIEKEQEEKIEELASELLKREGILICPYVAGPILIYKKDGKIKRFLTKEEYVFVPLIDS